MSSLNFLNPAGLFMEISQTSWQVLNGAAFVEFPLERLENGQLTNACRERATAGLRDFLNKDGWRPRRRAFVAIGARGVSLRRLSLPPAPKEEFQRLLRLQIESEFPLSPDELAWGWQSLGQKSGRQEVLVAAVKKDVIEPYAQILHACGISPLFALAALARNALRPPPAPTCAVFHIGAAESELLSFQDGSPVAIRLLSWGADSAAPPPASIGAQVYLTGKGARHPSVVARLAQCPVFELGPGTDRSAAIAGLKKLAANEGGVRPLYLETGESRNGSGGVASRKWAAAAVLLLMALLCLPWAEAILLKPHLEKKLAAIQADRARLPAIDHELEFLQFLKRSQPPYLDTMYLISKAAPQGTSFETVSLSRRGDLSLRGKMANAQQVTDFRSNMIASAWFSSVVVEEQTPTPDRRVTIRMSAQLKPIDARKPLVVDLPPSKPEHATNSAGPPNAEKK